MARPESKIVMGYLPIEPRHHAAIMSLVAPGTPAHKLLNPYAGEGEFLDYAAKSWNITPYANELDVDAWPRIVMGGLTEQVITLPHLK